MTLAFPLLLAFGGGIASFASPCVLPLVPVYLSVVTGADAPTLDVRRGQGRLLTQTALFVAGFSVVFVLLGTTASMVGRAVALDHVVLTRLAGALIVLMACLLAGSQLLRAPLLGREWRLEMTGRRLGPLAAVLTGAAFGFGWTPCIGPILASVLAVASTEGQSVHGALLLAAYSLGLGVPFLLGGLLLGRLGHKLAALRRHVRSLSLASAAVMAGLGVLLLAGQLSLLDGAAAALR